MIWNERKLVQNRILNDIPRTALAEVDAAKILEPLSSSREPLFHTRHPAASIGRFS